MATKKKMLQAAAGNVGGAGLDITDVFSTYLYAGTSAEHTITNGIDLAGEGGMIWGKIRSSTDQHWIVDSERGTGSNSNYKYVMPNLTTSELDFASRSVSSFNSNGFTLQNGTDKQFNESGYNYASWSFRKAPKFYTCVTWTGDGTNGRAIPHNLGGTVGTLIIKATNGASHWITYHRDLSENFPASTDVLFLDLTNSKTGVADVIKGVSDTTFTVGNNSAANGNSNIHANNSGYTYVAYLFAHNDGDGEFGPDGDQDIIKCGSYTGDGSTDGSKQVELGWEPQWLLIKQSSGGTNNWQLYDTMRGIVTGTNSGQSKVSGLYPNNSDPEDLNLSRLTVNQTGFSPSTADGSVNASGATYIYMAIRRGPLAQPESGTEVFEPVYSNNGPVPTFRTGFPVDLTIHTPTSGADKFVATRLLGQTRLRTNTTGAEDAQTEHEFDYMNGSISYANLSGYIGWNWKRAPGFCEILTYSGNSTAGRTVSHNLGVAPEMMWVKKRSGAESWAVYHKLYGGTHFARLNQTGAFESNSNVWDNTNPTASVFTVDQDTEVNQSGQTYIAYLFATVAGVSKVGSVSHTSGSATNVDCGFTSGARFILLKVADSSGSWFVYDTARGIVAGNDARLKLDSSAAENTGNDDIDPLSSGFTITSTVSTGSYIFYAIA